MSCSFYNCKNEAVSGSVYCKDHKYSLVYGTNFIEKILESKIFNPKTLNILFPLKKTKEYSWNTDHKKYKNAAFIFMNIDLLNDYKDSVIKWCPNFYNQKNNCMKYNSEKSAYKNINNFISKNIDEYMLHYDINFQAPFDYMENELYLNQNIHTSNIECIYVPNRKNYLKYKAEYPEYNWTNTTPYPFYVPPTGENLIKNRIKFYNKYYNMTKDEIIEELIANSRNLYTKDEVHELI